MEVNMEYVVVRFSQKRTVYIDGNESGETNQILSVGTGDHVFRLGGPENYEPKEIPKRIQNTTSLKPEIITFEEVRNEI
jgi:hypothetical protein